MRGEKFATANPSPPWRGGSEVSRLRPAVAGLRSAKEVRTGGNRQMVYLAMQQITKLKE